MKTTSMALLITAGLALGSPALAAGIADLQPHRAVYDLKLDRSAPGGGVGDVRGRIVYELTGSACEGYAQTMRFVTETTSSEGATEQTDLRTSSWEAVPAGRFRFSYSTYQNDQLADRTQGTAHKAPGTDGPVSVDVTKPQKRAANVAGPVYFPIEHSLAIIRSAKAGERIFAGNLYDGSEGGEKVYATTSVIGRAIPDSAQRFNAKFKNAGLLAGVASWPVSISYFVAGQNKVDAVPLYEMSFRFHENGVTGNLSIDHGSYSLAGEITELTYLERNPCTPGPAPR